MQTDIAHLGPRKSWMELFFAAFLFSGCGATHLPALEGAREVYQKAQQDPLIVQNAGSVLERARQTLESADRLWKKEHDVDEVEHLAYLVQKRIEIARATAERRLAAKEIEQAELRP